MDEENRNRKKVVIALKKVYDIEPLKGIRLDLSSFYITNKGKHFRYLYTWKINDTFNNIYLCSLRNSYEKEGMNNNYFFSKSHVSGRYLSLLIESKIKVPDLIIRPSSLGDRIANLLLNGDIKLGYKNKFDKKYILESNNSKSNLQKLLSKDLTDLIEKQNNFYMEICNSRIFLKLEQEMETQGALDLLGIGKLIDHKIRIVA